MLSGRSEALSTVTSMNIHSHVPLVYQNLPNGGAESATPQSMVCEKIFFDHRKSIDHLTKIL